MGSRAGGKIPASSMMRVHNLCVTVAVAMIRRYTEGSTDAVLPGSGRNPAQAAYAVPR